MLSAAAIGLVTPASALAVKPTVTSGAAANITFQSARLNGSVDANKQATNYFFQYGTTIALGTQTAGTPAGGADKAVRVSTDIAGLAPVTKYYYRIVAQNSSGTALGKRRSFTTRRQPLGVSLAATPNPVKASNSTTTLAGTLSGTGNAGRKVVLQANPWPYTAGFQPAANEQVTNATGGFSFPILSVAFNTQYRVQMPERPQIVSPIVAFGVKPYVKSKVNKHRVQRGKRIKFSGSVKPAAAGSRSRSRSGTATPGSPSAARSCAAAAAIRRASRSGAAGPTASGPARRRASTRRTSARGSRSGPSANRTGRERRLDLRLPRGGEVEGDAHEPVDAMARPRRGRAERRRQRQRLARREARRPGGHGLDGHRFTDQASGGGSVGGSCASTTRARGALK